jgi:hypothetical protein
MSTEVVAFWGSLIGGGLGALSGFFVVYQQKRVERQERRAQLLHRLKYILPRIGSIGEATVVVNESLRERSDLLDEVIELRASYERVADFEMYLGGDSDLTGKVRTFIVEAAIVANQALTADRELARLEYERGNGRSISDVVDPIQSRLGQAKNRMATWKGEADEYMRELGAL